MDGAALQEELATALLAEAVEPAVTKKPSKARARADGAEARALEAEARAHAAETAAVAAEIRAQAAELRAREAEARAEAAGVAQAAAEAETREAQAALKAALSKMKRRPKEAVSRPRSLPPPQQLAPISEEGPSSSTEPNLSDVQRSSSTAADTSAVTPLSLMTSSSGVPTRALACGPAGPPAPAPALPKSGKRNVFIQLVGIQGVGKSALLEAFVKATDPASMQKFMEQKGNLMSHHRMQMGDQLLSVLDCSGNPRAAHLVKEWFGRSAWVFVVYNVADAKSLESALETAKEAEQAGASVVLFGNTFFAERDQPVQAPVMEVKELVSRWQGLTVASSRLLDAVRIVLSAPGALSGKASTSQGPGLLRPSLLGTSAQQMDLQLGLLPVQELQAPTSVTCLVFGQERLRPFLLLAVGARDGSVETHRIYRTELEKEMLVESPFTQADVAPPPDGSNAVVHSRMEGHTRGIQSMVFNPLGDVLMTSSIDKTVRFWNVDTGELLKVSQDSGPVPVSIYLPCSTNAFVQSNSNAVLRVVNLDDMSVQKKLKVESEVRAMTLDSTEKYLFAGTRKGTIHVLQVTPSPTFLEFIFNVQLSEAAVTCIQFVKEAHGRPPCILVNCTDSSVRILDCIYSQGVLTELTLRHRLPVDHMLLPIKCCYSPSDTGYLISGAEDKEVNVFSMSDCKKSYLRHHQVPVVAVAELAGHRLGERRLHGQRGALA